MRPFYSSTHETILPKFSFTLMGQNISDPRSVQSQKNNITSPGGIFIKFSNHLHKHVQAKIDNLIQACLYQQFGKLNRGELVEASRPSARSNFNHDNRESYCIRKLQFKLSRHLIDRSSIKNISNEVFSNWGLTLIGQFTKDIK